MTWPKFMFCGAVPEKWMYRRGKLYPGKPLQLKTRTELLATIEPHYCKYVRQDTRDLLLERQTTAVA